MSHFTAARSIYRDKKRKTGCRNSNPRCLCSGKKITRRIEKVLATMLSKYFYITKQFNGYNFISSQIRITVIFKYFNSCNSKLLCGCLKKNFIRLRDAQEEVYAKNITEMILVKNSFLPVTRFPVYIPHSREKRVVKVRRRTERNVDGETGSRKKETAATWIKFLCC